MRISLPLLTLLVGLPFQHPAAAQTTTATHTTPAHHATTRPALPKNIPPARGLIHTAYSLKYIDTKIGTGELAPTHKWYTVNYTGWVAADGKKFDSSFDHGAPFTFPAGAHRVIPGWDTGFEGMHIGGKRRLFIPYQLAYGETGHPPAIPPKADLIFDIELLSVSDKPPAPPTPPKPPTTPGQPASPPVGAANPTPPATPPASAPAAQPATPPPAATAKPATPPS